LYIDQSELWFKVLAVKYRVEVGQIRRGERKVSTWWKQRVGKGRDVLIHMCVYKRGDSKLICFQMLHQIVVTWAASLSFNLCDKL